MVLAIQFENEEDEAIIFSKSCRNSNKTGAKIENKEEGENDEHLKY